MGKIKPGTLVTRKEGYSEVMSLLRTGDVGMVLPKPNRDIYSNNPTLVRIRLLFGPRAGHNVIAHVQSIEPLEVAGDGEIG